MGLIADVKPTDRPVLGNEVPLLVFRAFRHFSGGYVDDVLGRGAAVVFQNGGRELGREAGAMLYKPNLDEYLLGVCQFVRESRIGILTPREVTETLIVVDLDECITCSGLSNIGKRVCHFEVGFVAGVVEALVKKKTKATELKCCANGEGTCQVAVEINQVAVEIND